MAKTGRQLVRPIRRDNLDLFDSNPFTIHGFKFRARRVEAVGRPSLEQWGAAFAFAVASEESAPFWVGDLYNYGEGRQDWTEKLEQALGEAGRHLTHKTLINMGYISRKVQGKARHLAPSLAHAGEVAAEDPDKQVELLDKAKTEGWSVRDLRVTMRSAKRRMVVEGRAVLEGQYRVLLVDCPWRYRDGGRGKGTAAEGHYPGLSIEELCKLPVEAHCEQDAVMGFWIPSPMLMDDPGPRDVINAWGFTYKAEMVWNKVLGNPGHYATQVIHEHFLICTRGSCLPDVPLPHAHSVYTERRSAQHSEKPAYFRKFLEQHWTEGRRVELFASERNEGWTAFGNDARLWAKEAKVAV